MAARIETLPAVAQNLSALPIPTLVEAAGETAAMRFIEFFTAKFRIPNMWAACTRAVINFFRWCERHGLWRVLPT